MEDASRQAFRKDCWELAKVDETCGVGKEMDGARAEGYDRLEGVKGNKSVQST